MGRHKRSFNTGFSSVVKNTEPEIEEKTYESGIDFKASNSDGGQTVYDAVMILDRDHKEFLLGLTINDEVVFFQPYQVIAGQVHKWHIVIKKTL